MRGVIIGPQHPGAVFPTIVPPSIKGPSIGFAGSKMPSVSSDTRTVRLPLFGSSATFMILFLRLYLSGGFEWPSIYRNSPGDQRSTFSVWRLAFGVWRRGQNGANTFELTPAALLLGFAQPKLYERL